MSAPSRPLASLCSIACECCSLRVVSLTHSFVLEDGDHTLQVTVFFLHKRSSACCGSKCSRILLIWDGSARAQGSNVPRKRLTSGSKSVHPLGHSLMLTGATAEQRALQRESWSCQLKPSSSSSSGYFFDSHRFEGWRSTCSCSKGRSSILSV